MKPHFIDCDELIEYVDRESKMLRRYAGSSFESKALYCSLEGTHYAVHHGTKVVWQGSEPAQAVAEYNAITGPPVTVAQELEARIERLEGIINRIIPQRDIMD